MDKEILVLGIGNVLLGDEGIGVKAVEALDKIDVPDNVSLLDGGTGGFHLLPEIEKFNNVIIIDATLDDQDVGTISLLRPKYAFEFPRTLSAHDIGLKDLLESATLIGKFPNIHLITVSISPHQEVTTSLSPEVKKCIPAIIELVLKQLAEI